MTVPRSERRFQFHQVGFDTDRCLSVYYAFWGPHEPDAGDWVRCIVCGEILLTQAAGNPYFWWDCAHGLWAPPKGQWAIWRT